MHKFSLNFRSLWHGSDCESVHVLFIILFSRWNLFFRMEEAGVGGLDLLMRVLLVKNTLRYKIMYLCSQSKAEKSVGKQVNNEKINIYQKATHMF